MTTISLGKIAFTWRSTYNASSTYMKQDVVSYNGDSFVCVLDNTMGVIPTDASPAWDLFAQGSTGISNSSGQIIYNNGTGLVALPAGTLVRLPQGEVDSVVRAGATLDEHRYYRADGTPGRPGAARPWRVGAQVGEVVALGVGQTAGEIAAALAARAPAPELAGVQVGDEVRQAFLDTDPDCGHFFLPDAEGKWLADLPGLARRRLTRLGLQQIDGHDGRPEWCTVSNASSFFSHRRDAGVFGSSGRMAALVWLEG